MKDLLFKLWYRRDKGQAFRRGYLMAYSMLAECGVPDWDEATVEEAAEQAAQMYFEGVL